MSDPSERARIEQLSEQAEEEDRSWVADLVAATVSEEGLTVELLILAVPDRPGEGAKPYLYDLDRKQATALRDQLTNELARLVSPEEDPDA
jgi:hypothetical protein